MNKYLLCIGISMLTSNYLMGDNLGYSLPVIPKPQHVVKIGNKFTLPDSFRINFIQDDAKPIAKSLIYWLKEQVDLEVKNSSEYIINLVINPNCTSHEEGYNMKITSRIINVEAKSEAGLFYGVQTLKQLIEHSVLTKSKLPQVMIKDYPRFKWRGMHLDVSRHFFAKEFIKKYLDYLARYKINTFHWHLVDGPGWRIQIDKYPKLTKIGAWRKDKTNRSWNWRATELCFDGKTPNSYGGYYSKKDIREIIAYAKERFITIIPEIEMPGHSYAALVAYPEFACPTNNIKVDGLLGKDVFCVGNEKSYQFLEDILDEVIELFPSEYIHIGADEVPKMAWAQCPICQRCKKKLKLKNDKELQNYFVTRIEKYLLSKNKKLIGWDEITEGELSKQSTVMVWRDDNFALKSLKQGHPIIMCPGTHCYFDYYQSKSKNEPKAIGGFLPTKKVYEFNPIITSMPKSQHHLVLGGQANLWSEFIQTPSHVEYMIFPRMCALAETVWSNPMDKNWSDFSKRLITHKIYWQKKKINYHKK